MSTASSLKSPVVWSSKTPSNASLQAPLDGALHRPRSLADLFFSFMWLALQGFGGVLVVAQQELVERKQWLTREKFVEDWAIAQVMPGPNVVNLSMMFGARYFGWRGSLAAMSGLLLAPLLLVLVLVSLYSQWSHSVALQGALRGMGAVAAGLIMAAALKLLPALRHNPMGLIPSVIIMGATLCLIVLLQWPLIGVLTVVGSTAVAWAWRQHAVSPKSKPANSDEGQP